MQDTEFVLKFIYKTKFKKTVLKRILNVNICVEKIRFIII